MHPLLWRGLHLVQGVLFHLCSYFLLPRYTTIRNVCRQRQPHRHSSALPQSGALPQPFGFAGELHSEGLIYLRARWYDPGSGTFPSRDPFDGFERMPYSLHPYQYAYADPVRWTDASGRQVEERVPVPCGPATVCLADPSFGEGLVVRLKEAIWDAARHYAQFTMEPGWDADTLAVLMGSILIHENSPGEMSKRGWENMQSEWANLTTGIANLRPGSVLEILNCIIPLGPRDEQDREWSLQMDFSTLGGDRYPDLDRNGYWYHLQAHALLQQEGVSIDLLAANLVRGIRRAQYWGISPSLFNVATWHNGGIIKGFGGKEVSYVIGVFEQLHRVAGLLGARLPERETQPPMPGTLNIYNQSGESGADELGTLLDRVRLEPGLVCRIGYILPERSWYPLNAKTICGTS